MEYQSYHHFGKIFTEKVRADVPEALYHRYDTEDGGARFYITLLDGACFGFQATGFNMYLNAAGEVYFPAGDLIRLFGLSGEPCRLGARYGLTAWMKKAVVVTGGSERPRLAWVMTYAGALKLMDQNIAGAPIPACAAAFFGELLLALAVKEGGVLGRIKELERVIALQDSRLKNAALAISADCMLAAEARAEAEKFKQALQAAQEESPDDRRLTQLTEGLATITARLEQTLSASRQVLRQAGASSLKAPVRKESASELCL